MFRHVVCQAFKGDDNPILALTVKNLGKGETSAYIPPPCVFLIVCLLYKQNLKGVYRMARHNAISQEEIFALQNKLYTKKEFIEKFNRHIVTVNKWFNSYRN
jgi:hypothetical protein